VTVDITNISGTRLGVKGSTIAVNFDVKARLDERIRKSQMVTVSFILSLGTKPSIMKFEVEGTATLSGKNEEINKMLEVDPELKMPYVFQSVYQNAFAAMYLLSNILKVPPPPHNLLLPQSRGTATRNVDVESRIGVTKTNEQAEKLTIDPSNVESARVASKASQDATRSVNVQPRADQKEPEEHVNHVAEGSPETES